MNFIHLKTVDSTNTYALNLLREVAQNAVLQKSGVRALDKTVVVAEKQTAGKGRVGRSFFSPATTGVYFTAIYAPLASIQSPAKLTVAAAVAVCRSLEKIFGVEAKIKWVNDVYVNGKKVCGILAEGHIDKATQKIDAAVVGIGINIFPQDFPPEIASKAGAVLQNGEGVKNSLQLAEISSTKKNLVESVCQNLFAFYDAAASTPDGVSNNIIAEYKSRSFLIGKKIQVVPVAGQAAGAYFATTLDIDSEARLVVQTESGEVRRLDSGEVSVLASK